MIFIEFLLAIAAAVLAFYVLFPFLSLIISVLFKKAKGTSGKDLKVDFACIITAYGDASQAITQVDSLLKQTWKSFHIYVVADHCQEKPQFTESPQLSVIYPEKSLHSKIRSIQLAIQSFVRNHSHILILDADNLLHPDCLQGLEESLRSGYTAVQGQRTAKNLDTPMAALDAMSEIYYNITQRFVPFRIGSSATIAGSGMAIEASFFRKYVQALTGDGSGLIIAEDKLLQMMLATEGHRIAYCREAIIFDEKVREGHQVQRQRTRWLKSWFDHWGQSMKIMLRGIGSLDWNGFYFGLMLSVPPMVMLVGAILLLIIAGIFVSPALSWLAAISLGFFLLGFLLALALAPAPRRVWAAIPYIPSFAFRQILAMLKIKAASRDFMVTTHSQNQSIEEVWEQRKADFPYLKS